MPAPAPSPLRSSINKQTRSEASERVFCLSGNPIQPFSVFQGDFLKYAAQYGELLAVGVLMCTPIPYRVWDRVKKPWAIAVVLAVILFSCVYYLFQGSNDPFLYFSF